MTTGRSLDAVRILTVMELGKVAGRRCVSVRLAERTVRYGVIS